VNLVILLLTMLAHDPAHEPATATSSVSGTASIDATIRGTAQPLDVELLLRNESEKWISVAQKRLDVKTRRVRFDHLKAGVYQLLLRGPVATEQLGTKIMLGGRDQRRTTIEVSPFELTGRIDFSGAPLGGGGVLLHHKELGWKAAVKIEDDGTFRAPLWQHGTFRYTIKNRALATNYDDFAEITGAPLAIEIPDGRVTGIVRDAKSGQPLANVLVVLTTKSGDVEQNLRLETDRAGRFDFTGAKFGQHTVRFLSSNHLDAPPIAFALDASSRLRELDVELDPGRTIPIVVVGTDNEPVENALVFAVSDAKLRSRTTTDNEGRTMASVPIGEPAALFVVPPSGAFGVQRLQREHDGQRVWIHLPRAASSLLIRAQTTDGKTMPPFQLLMRYDGAIVPTEVADELAAVLGLQLAAGGDSEALLQNIPSGSYEFWPYRTEQEAEAILASSDGFAAPIVVNVHEGENKVAVKFAARN
jgi:5-hydroxyisourate hydrolase-like protein (transthyretin family)